MQVSLAYIGSYRELPGPVDIPFSNQGYDTVIDHIRANIPEENILLGHVVSKVNYAHNGSGVEVTCENGAVFTADHVIVTSSLGYLQEHAASMFTPPLPDAKLAAIQRLGFGTVNRIYIEFNNLTFIPGEYVGEIWTVQDKYDDEVTSWEEQVYTFYVQDTPRANVLTSRFCGTYIRQRTDPFIISVTNKTVWVDSSHICSVTGCDGLSIEVF